MVNEKRLIDEFCRLVSFDSESYQETEIAAYLKKKLESLGLTVNEDNAGKVLKDKHHLAKAGPGNLFAVLEGNTEGEPVLLVSHMDTVKPGTGKKAVVHDDGTITSAGDTVLGSDDIAGLAEILETLAVIQEKHLKHPRIEVLMPVAEEPYCQGTSVFDFSVITARKAYVLDDAGPIGHAADAAPSIISVKITVKGKSAHAGFHPEQGINAIAAAAEAVSHIPQGHINPETTVNLGTIEGGKQSNIVSENVVITGEIRSMSNELAEDAVESMKNAFAGADQKYGTKSEVNTEVMFPAYRIDPSETVVQEYEHACRKLQIEPVLEDTFGGSDNNHLAEHGIRGIVTACGYYDPHTVREHSSVQELKQASELLIALATGE